MLLRRASLRIIEMYSTRPWVWMHCSLRYKHGLGLVISETTTWVFQVGPVINLVAIILAGLVVPFGPFGAPVSFTGDLILFAYLFGLARFFTTSAALDTGSAFEGMGAAREVTFACFSEPALFFALLVLGKLSGSLSLTPMLHSPVAAQWSTAAAPLV